MSIRSAEPQPSPARNLYLKKLMQMKSKRLLRGSLCALLASNTSLAFAQSSAVSNSILVAPDENAETGFLREVVVALL